MKIQLAHVAARQGGGVSLKIRLTDDMGHREVRRLELTTADWERIARELETENAKDSSSALECAVQDSAVRPDSPPNPAVRLGTLQNPAARLGTLQNSAATAKIQTIEAAPPPFSSLAGCYLTPEQYDELEHAGDFCSALNKGASLLSYGANSKRALELKLRRHGYDSELCDRVGDELERRGLIREQNDADSVVRVCLRSGYGYSRIVAKLRQKGYGDEVIRAATEDIDDSVYVKNCAAIIQKKYGFVPDDTEGRRKLTAALVRYGYSFSQIKSAMRTLDSDD